MHRQRLAVLLSLVFGLLTTFLPYVAISRWRHYNSYTTWGVWDIAPGWVLLSGILIALFLLVIDDKNQSLGNASLAGTLVILVALSVYVVLNIIHFNKGDITVLDPSYEGGDNVYVRAAFGIVMTLVSFVICLFFIFLFRERGATNKASRPVREDDVV